MELNKVYQMDCLEFMKGLPDKCFDLVLTDPPYGIGAAKEKPHNGWKDWGINSWDDDSPSEEYFKQMFRVSKNQIIFGANHFIFKMPLNSSCWIVWDKGQKDFSLADGELAWTSFPKALRIFKFARAKVNSGLGEHRYHPTQKPVALGRWILEKFAEQGQTIFDPFAGSGSFLLACKQKGFTYVGCEINKEYFEVIEERLTITTVGDFSSELSLPSLSQTTLSTER